MEEVMHVVQLNRSQFFDTVIDWQDGNQSIDAGETFAIEVSVGPPADGTNRRHWLKIELEGLVNSNVELLQMEISRNSKIHVL